MPFSLRDAPIGQFESQVGDVIDYLKRNSAAIDALVNSPGVEDAYVGFALPQLHVDARSEIFPAMLVSIAGNLRLGLGFSLYAIAESE